MLKKNCKSHLISLVLFLISFSCSSAFAEAINVKKEKSAVEAKKAQFTKTPLIEDTTFEQDMLETNRGIGLWFDQMADNVDLFLVGHRVTTKPNNSRIVFENTTYSRETSNLTNLTNISFNPAFPNLEKYWNLKFTTYDDTAISRGDEKGYARATPRQNYAATVGLFRKFDDVRVAYEPRIEIRGEPQ